MALKLGDICEIVSGATPKTGVKSFWDGKIPWATPADLSNLEGAYITDTPRRLTEAGLASCSAPMLPANSVLFSSRAPIGHVAINTVPMATNQGFKSLVPRAGLANAKFLFHWLRYNKAKLQSLGNGATFKEVSKAVVSEIGIDLPPLDEQLRIAAILDNADALRQKRKRAMALLDRLMQSIFLEMFGDAIENPRAFPAVPLEDLVSPSRRITYGILMPGDDLPDGVPYVRVTDIQNGQVLSAQLRRTSRRIADEYRRSTLNTGDLLISIRGHVGRMAIVPVECDGANITQDTARLALVGADAAYVMAVLGTAGAQHWMLQRTKGAAVRGINLGDLKRFPIPLPPAELQSAFARRASKAASLAALSRETLPLVDQQFASLQQRAFSGRL